MVWCVGQTHKQNGPEKKHSEEENGRKDEDGVARMVGCDKCRRVEGVTSICQTAGHRRHVTLACGRWKFKVDVDVDVGISRDGSETRSLSKTVATECNPVTPYFCLTHHNSMMCIQCLHVYKLTQIAQL